jgi:PAS domain S-box-containing protein
MQSPTETRDWPEGLEALLDEIPGPAGLIDPVAIRYIAVNEQVCRMRGVTRDEMMALGPLGFSNNLTITHESLQRRYQDLIDIYPRSRRALQSFVQADGKAVEIEIVRRAVPLAGRWAIFAITVLQLDRPLQPGTEPAFRNMLDLTGDAVVLIDPRRMRVIEANRGAQTLLGHSQAELVSGGLALQFTGLRSGEAVEALFQRLIAESPRALVVESELRRRDGTTITARITQQAVDHYGSWIVVLTARDITQEVESRRALERFRAAIDHSAESLILVDRETMKVIDVNLTAAKRAGLTREEYVAGPVWERIAGGSREAMERKYDEVIAMAPQVQVEEQWAQRANGPPFPAEISRRAVRVDGRWVIVVSGRDVTDRKRAQDELQRRLDELARSNHELERFAYVASHDLMEPLRMVASYTQLLDRRYRKQLDADAGEFMDFIVGGARRMKLLLDDLLAYSRVGRLGDKPARVPMDQVLDDVLENLQVLIAEKGATIERGPLPVLECNRTEMTQLLQNLVGNALKFQDGSRRAQVRIEAQDDGGAWTFSVADNGIGIAAEHFERIFALFQRLHGREAYGGTGIGLAICKKIVEQRGGRIWVESEPGVGTTFSFTVPHAA